MENAPATMAATQDTQEAVPSSRAAADADKKGSGICMFCPKVLQTCLQN